MMRRCKQARTRESRKTFKGEATWTIYLKTLRQTHPCQPEEEEEEEEEDSEEEGVEEVEDFSEEEKRWEEQLRQEKIA